MNIGKKNSWTKLIQLTLLYMCQNNTFYLVTNLKLKKENHTGKRVMACFLLNNCFKYLGIKIFKIYNFLSKFYYQIHRLLMQILLKFAIHSGGNLMGARKDFSDLLS